MNLWRQALIMLVVSLCSTAAPGTGANRSFKGRMAAYRPADGVMQVASFAINQETFLFRTDGGSLLKLRYRHQGYSDIKGDVLSGSQEISIFVHRDASCDQTVGAFENEAPAIPIEGAGAASRTDRVVFASSVSRPPESYRLKCYRLERWEPVKQGESSKAGNR